MTTADHVWSTFTPLELRAHLAAADAPDLNTIAYLERAVQLVAAQIDADEQRMVPRERRHVREARLPRG